MADGVMFDWTIHGLMKILMVLGRLAYVVCLLLPLMIMIIMFISGHKSSWTVLIRRFQAFKVHV